MEAGTYMSCLFPKNISYERVSGSWVNGEWVTTMELATFRGDVQPATGKDISPEVQARLDKGGVQVYSDVPLKVSLEGTANSGDVVHYQGQRWEIISEGRHQNSLIPHYKYIGKYLGEVV